MHLLDTSALIDVFVNRKGSEKIREFLAGKEYFISIISVYELRKSVSLDARIDQFLNHSKVLTITPESASISSDVFKKMRKKGIEVNDADILISGIAILHGLIVVTKDTNFEQISNASELKTKMF